MNEEDTAPDDIIPKVCIVPTWEQSALMLCAILKDGTPEGRESAERRIIEMGKILDQMGVKVPR